MIYKNEILDLKTDITEKIGQKIIVKGSLGRTKSFEKEATIEKTYPNIFVIKYEEDDRNVTYSYTDVLTRTVEVEVFDGVGYSPLIPPYQKEKSKRGRKVQLENINRKRKHGIKLLFVEDFWNVATYTKKE